MFFSVKYCLLLLVTITQCKQLYNVLCGCGGSSEKMTPMMSSGFFRVRENPLYKPEAGSLEDEGV